MKNNNYNKIPDLVIDTQLQDSKEFIIQEKSTKENRFEKKPIISISIFKLHYEFCEKWDYFLTIIAIISSIGLGSIYIMFEFLVGSTINDLIPNNKSYKNYMETISRDSWRFVFFGLLAFIFTSTSNIIWFHLGQKLSYKFKVEYFKMILSQEQGWFDSINPFEFSSKIESQTNAIENGVN